jgi:hypothetical protein
MDAEPESCCGKQEDLREVTDEKFENNLRNCDSIQNGIYKPESKGRVDSIY